MWVIVLALCILNSGPVVQWLERTAHNGDVAGSIPAGPTPRFIKFVNGIYLVCS